MTRRIPGGVLVAGVVVSLALAAYDAAQAVTVRCVRAADKNSVVMLDELDALPGSPLFTFAVGQGSRARRGAASSVRIRSGSQLTISGTADAWRAHGSPAVFAEVDGDARVQAQRQEGEEFRLVIPSRLLAPGPHRVTFAVVNKDLSGYFVPPADLRVNVESVAVRAPKQLLPVRRGRPAEQSNERIR